jgi:hypothetical protein
VAYYRNSNYTKLKGTRKKVTPFNMPHHPLFYGPNRTMNFDMCEIACRIYDPYLTATVTVCNILETMGQYGAEALHTTLRQFYSRYRPSDEKRYVDEGRSPPRNM